MPDSKCPKCDRGLAGGEAFCPGCGISLKGLVAGTKDGQPGPRGVERASSRPRRAAAAVAQEAGDGEVLFERFRILEELGAGGMGVVYRAEDRVERVVVAVKTLHPGVAGDRAARERLRGEVLAAKGLRNPHVVGVYNLFEDGDSAGFSMELLEGATLEEHLAGRVEGSPFGGPATVERLPWVEALADQLGRALDAIHQTPIPGARERRPLVHRDVTPANVMIAPLPRDATPDDLHATLTDFGISHVVGERRFTAAGVAGRLGYIAPELHLSGAEPTPAADLWSYGLLLYHALTGRQATVTVNMPRPSSLVEGLPEAVDHVVLSCLRSAEQRPKRAARVAAAMRGVFGSWLDEAPVKVAERIRERHDLIRIEPGAFLMGSPRDPRGQSDVEVQHRVRLTRSFELGRTQVTQASWTSLMGENPSVFEGADRPVERVSWFDAVEFCNRLSLRAGIRPAYRIEGRDVTWIAGADGFRLPTEAEWEYAARAGEGHRYAGSDEPDVVAVWNRYQPATPAEQQRGTAPVGSKQPNAWGLYDMSGNVWEWCWDWFGRYPEELCDDPPGPPSGTVRVARGGSWSDHSPRCLQVSDRNRKAPTSRYGYLGFRLARSLT